MCMISWVKLAFKWIETKGYPSPQPVFNQSQMLQLENLVFVNSNPDLIYTLWYMWRFECYHLNFAYMPTHHTILGRGVRGRHTIIDIEIKSIKKLRQLKSITPVLFIIPLHTFSTLQWFLFTIHPYTASYFFCSLNFQLSFHIFTNCIISPNLIPVSSIISIHLNITCNHSLLEILLHIHPQPSTK